MFSTLSPFQACGLVPLRRAPRLAAGVSAALSSSAFPSALHTSHRGAASYPSPRPQRREQQARKQFNYLTSERLVRTLRLKMNRDALRARDDKALQRRRDYRGDVLRDIEEKIHYFPPEVKSFIFFPSSRLRNTKRLFRGNRVLDSRTFTRIHVLVIETLCKLENRKALVAAMKKAGIVPPLAAEFRRYCDPVTGDINCPLVHSLWLERHFLELGRKHATALAQPRDDKGNVDTRCVSMSPQQAYVLMNFGNDVAVQTLQAWSRQLGPLDAAKELAEVGRSQVVAVAARMESRVEIMRWGRSQIEAAVAPLTVAEQQALVETAIRRFLPRMQKLSCQMLFAAKVMLAVNALPEVKAMQTPSKVFFRECELQAVVRQGGLCFPRVPSTLKEWRALGVERQAQYYCFGRKAEGTVASPQLLYMRYATRDYGLHRVEAAKRFAKLTDEQQAALQFCFYYPIAPKSSANMAFRAFNREMCVYYGLARGTGAMTNGSRLFEAAMRKKWRLMPAEERQKYFNDEAIRAAFPLQPAAGPATAEDEEDAANAVDEVTVVSHDTVDTEPELDILRIAQRAEKSTKRRNVAPKPKSKRTAANRVAAQRKRLFVYSAAGPRIVNTGADAVAHGSITAPSQEEEESVSFIVV